MNIYEHSKLATSPKLIAHLEGIQSPVYLDGEMIGYVRLCESWAHGRHGWRYVGFAAVPKSTGFYEIPDSRCVRKAAAVRAVAMFHLQGGYAKRASRSVIARVVGAMGTKP